MDLNEEEWRQQFEEAVLDARQNGPNELADYISLKASNDAIRMDASKWFMENVIEIVFAFNNKGARIKIDQKDNHKFCHANSTLTGSQLKLQQGVRCLTVEAGWTRNPGDGIMRGGALVYARMSHFGFVKGTEEFLLLKFEEKPQWFSVVGEFHRVSFSIKMLKPHFEQLLLS